MRPRITNLTILVAGLLVVSPLARRTAADGDGLPNWLPLLSVAKPPAAFTDGLRALGYAEGQNVVIHFRGAGGNSDRLPALVTRRGRRSSASGGDECRSIR